MSLAHSWHFNRSSVDSAGSLSLPVNNIQHGTWVLFPGSVPHLVPAVSNSEGETPRGRLMQRQECILLLFVQHSNPVRLVGVQGCRPWTRCFITELVRWEVSTDPGFLYARGGDSRGLVALHRPSPQRRGESRGPCSPAETSWKGELDGPYQCVGRGKQLFYHHLKNEIKIT